MSPEQSDEKDSQIRKINPLQAELSHKLMELFQQAGLTKGSHLAERDLAEKLGVSRSPVRAALKLLEHFNVVEQRPAGVIYWLVSRMSYTDLSWSCRNHP